MNPPDAPCPHGGPAFDAPWQAQVFALTLCLNEQGLFTWTEWADALGEALRAADADGADYYRRWLAALEAVLVGKHVLTAAELAEVTAAWHRAALATPHGAPLAIENDPLAGKGGPAVSASG